MKLHYVHLKEYHFIYDCYNIKTHFQDIYHIYLQAR